MIKQFQIIDDISQKIQILPINSNDFLPLLNTLIETIREKYKELGYEISRIESQYRDCLKELEQNLAEFPFEALKGMGRLTVDLYEHGQSRGIFKILDEYQKTNKISYSDYQKVRDYTKQSLAILAIMGGLSVLTGVGTWLWKKKKERDLRKKIVEYIQTKNSLLITNINSLRQIRQICEMQKNNFKSIINRIPQNDEKFSSIQKKVSYTIEIMNDAILKIDIFLSDPIIKLIK